MSPFRRDPPLAARLALESGSDAGGCSPRTGALWRIGLDLIGADDDGSPTIAGSGIRSAGVAEDSGGVEVSGTCVGVGSISDHAGDIQH